MTCPSLLPRSESRQVHFMPGPEHLSAEHAVMDDMSVRVFPVGPRCELKAHFCLSVCLLWEMSEISSYCALMLFRPLPMTLCQRLLPSPTGNCQQQLFHSLANSMLSGQ